ncbi:hypothetical protein A9Q74_13305 [Colwellia sp. 39_35_sub15_T18]|nr:hypothetical protein A9Q74_13305 [Colwellia sp. 39_35_sub15_T18]
MVTISPSYILVLKRIFPDTFCRQATEKLAYFTLLRKKCKHWFAKENMIKNKKSPKHTYFKLFGAF